MRDIERVDARLASLAREEGALRLRLGQVLEVLGRGAVFDLGFSSLGAYALERCERSVRWVEAARCLARRVEALPELRGAMAFGQVSWTMGEVLARVATPADEARWLELAEGRTVRQVRLSVEEAASLGCARARMKTQGAATLDPSVATAAMPREGDGELGDWASSDGALCSLTCTVAREDAWLFEATCYLLDPRSRRGSRCLRVRRVGRWRLLMRWPSDASAACVARHVCVVAGSRGAGPPLVAAWCELAALPVPGVLAGLAPPDPRERHGRAHSLGAWPSRRAVCRRARAGADGGLMSARTRA